MAGIGIGVGVGVMSENIKVDGPAQLCFPVDGSWFEGQLVSSDDDCQYTVYGSPAKNSAEDDQIAANRCELEGGQNCYLVTIFDHDQHTKYTVRHVCVQNGNGCVLKSKQLTFESEKSYKGQRADMVIQNFSPKLVGRNLNVYAGQMTFHFTDEQAQLNTSNPVCMY